MFCRKIFSFTPRNIFETPVIFFQINNVTFYLRISNPFPLHFKCNLYTRLSYLLYLIYSRVSNVGLCSHCRGCSCSSVLPCWFFLFYWWWLRCMTWSYSLPSVIIPYNFNSLCIKGTCTISRLKYKFPTVQYWFYILILFAWRLHRMFQSTWWLQEKELNFVV